jgi:hypothetical protein
MTWPDLKMMFIHNGFAENAAIATAPRSRNASDRKAFCHFGIRKQGRGLDPTYVVKGTSELGARAKVGSYHLRHLPNKRLPGTSRGARMLCGCDHGQNAKAEQIAELQT